MTHQENTILQVVGEVGLSKKQVLATLDLLKNGATVPFIARYRKEQTGSLDEVQVQNIRDTFTRWNTLNDRRETIVESLQEQELLTDELQAGISRATTLAELEDLYLPFRPKKRTRGTIARGKGLEPLAKALYAQNQDSIDFSNYIDPEKGVPDETAAREGACDIIAEWINEHALIRERLRTLFQKKGVLYSKVVKKKQTEASKYRDYFDWSELLNKTPAHRFHAIMRGQREGFLRARVHPGEDEALTVIRNIVVRSSSSSSQLVSETAKDAYARLLQPSMETDVLNQTRERADEEATRVFADNLKGLLMASPLGQKVLLAIDPGFRTGCKVAVLDAQGTFLHNTTIYPSLGKDQIETAIRTIASLCETYAPEAIAVGNGTAGRETEDFLRECGVSVPVIQVNESGASIYSGSEVARQEFGELDLTVRGAISIGRRLQDPLAELVKIDPKSIGVGQYQHDVNQSLLKKGLDDIVMSCVNAVGVEVNSASEQLLAYVSGIGPQVAKNIVLFRTRNGPLRSRNDLLAVPRLGAFVFEQAAGFLRIRGGTHPLDESAVHPERYKLVEQLAADQHCTISDLINKDSLRKNISLQDYISEDIGLPTLQDIITELAKPGRDPRPAFEIFSFAEEVHTIEDLRPGMKLPGIITNVTNFGAFVDIGVHQDGLLHISQLADHYVSNPAKEVQVTQKVHVVVLSVDFDRKRISLSMKSGATP